MRISTRSKKIGVWLVGTESFTDTAKLSHAGKVSHILIGIHISLKLLWVRRSDRDGLVIDMVQRRNIYNLTVIKK